MDSVELLDTNGDRVNPARLRINHQNRVLDTTTRLTILIYPRNRERLRYPDVVIDETPPVRCFLYDWMQYINFKLQREAQNIITAKEQQLPQASAFDAFPRSQATFCSIVSATWEPVYSDQGAQTAELYDLLDRLIKQPEPVFEPQELITSVRITSNGDVRVTANGDRRVAIVNDETLVEAA